MENEQNLLNLMGFINQNIYSILRADSLDRYQIHYNPMNNIIRFP